MLEIDGSYGEGGGQILRTALSLSCLLGRPFRIVNIRKKRALGRGRVGLMPQHLAVVRALKEICGARVVGDRDASMDLAFEPGPVRPGEYRFDVGTAGSTSLLLQAILPTLLMEKRPSSIALTGGTHVVYSPTFHYISEVFLPALTVLGIHARALIENYGFYPRGGGKVILDVAPSLGVRPLSSYSCNILNIRGISGVGNLPLSIAQRQKDAALRILEEEGYPAEIDSVSVPAFGAGTFIFLIAETDLLRAGFSALGERGKRAEIVGAEAARALIGHLKTGACLDEHLADQIVIYLAMTKGESSFTTSRISPHLLTNLWVIERFLNIRYRIEGDQGSPGIVTVSSQTCIFP
jgi:RNA 3'-terminal phosphate cyclase (ATP)